MTPFDVRSFGGEVRVAPSFCITFECKGTEAVTVWHPNGTSVATTLFDGPSGSGKTTFLASLYERIKSPAGSGNPLGFDFQPPLTGDTAAVAYIPQNPPMVQHWRVCDILPRDSIFLPAVFTGEDCGVLFRKRLGEFSGGQQRKLYASSALELLLHATPHAAFLILDETFDGLGVSEAARVLTVVGSTWSSATHAALHIVVVSHLDHLDIHAQFHGAMALGLSVITGDYESLVVELTNNARA